MPNLEILDHVVHQDIVLKKGMVVSDDQKGLNQIQTGSSITVGQNLVETRLS